MGLELDAVRETAPQRGGDRHVVRTPERGPHQDGPVGRIDPLAGVHRPPEGAPARGRDVRIPVRLEETAPRRQQIEREGKPPPDLALVAEIEALRPGIFEAGVEVAERRDHAGGRVLVVDRVAEPHETGIPGSEDRVPEAGKDAGVAVRGREQQGGRPGVEDPAPGAHDAPRVEGPDEPAPRRDVVEVVGDAPALRQHVLDPAGVERPVPARAKVQCQAGIRAPRVLEIDAEDLLGHPEIGLGRAPEPDDGPGGVSGDEVLQRVEVVAAVRVADEVLVQGVVAEGEAGPDLVAPQQEGEAFAHLELVFVVEDGQPPGFAERADGGREDAEMGLERAFRQVGTPVEVVVGVLEPELVDAGAPDERDERSHHRVALDEPARLLPDVVGHPVVVREVVAEGERMPVVHPVVQLAEEDEVAGLAQELAAGGAAPFRVGGGDPVVVRTVAGDEFGEDGEHGVVVTAAPDVPQKGLVLGGVVVGQEEVGAVAPDRTAQRGAPVAAAEGVGLVAVVVGRDAAERVERRLREPGDHPLVPEEPERRSAELVAPGLGHDVHRAAAGAAGLRGKPAGDHLELLDGLLRHQHAPALPREAAAAEPEEGALRVRPVDREAGVHGPLPAEGERPPVRVDLDRGLQQREPDEVPARDRERRDLFLVDVARGAGPADLQQGRFGVHRHRLLDGGEAEPQIEFNALADVKMEVFPPHGPEPRQGSDEVVLAAQHGPQREEAPVVRHHRPAVAAFAVHEFDRHPGERGAGVVAHETVHRRERLRGRGRTGKRQGQEPVNGEPTRKNHPRQHFRS